MALQLQLAVCLVAVVAIIISCAGINSANKASTRLDKLGAGDTTSSGSHVALVQGMEGADADTINHTPLQKRALVASSVVPFLRDQCTDPTLCTQIVDAVHLFTGPVSCNGIRNGSYSHPGMQHAFSSGGLTCASPGFMTPSDSSVCDFELPGVCVRITTEHVYVGLKVEASQSRRQLDDNHFVGNPGNTPCNYCAAASLAEILLQRK